MRRCALIETGKFMRTSILFFVTIVTLSVAVTGKSYAMQRSLSGITGLDIAETQRDCASDAHRFCGGENIAINAMERCLGRHLNELSARCRSHIGPTDFRKYHKKFK